ncbi:hypothetical protein OAG04_00050 [bacterium]|nr:hypothetical protein [bacterium]
MANIITAPESGIYFDGNTAGTGVIPVLTGDASGVAIQYDGYAGITISSSATGANYQDRFSIEGENGRLFGVSDQVIGSVFSVNDAAGLPLIDVDVESSFSKITLGQYGTDAIVISGSSVQVTGSNVVTEGHLSDENYVTSSEILSHLLTVDGANSNLDADKLDGQQGSYYLDYSNFSSTPAVNDVSETNLLNRLAALDSSDTIYIGDAGDDTTVVVRGTLQVDGSTTTINSNTLSIGDNQIVLNNDVTGTPTQNAGITVERGTATNASLIWDESNDYWKAGLAGSEVQLALTNGTYSGLRAQSTTKGDVGLGNVTNESKATMFASPSFTGAVTLSGSIQNNDSNTSIDLKDHGNYTWFRNAANRWIFQGGTGGDDWTQHFALNLEATGSGFNDKYAILGQQQNNGSAGGKYKGVRIVKSTGSSTVVDGELKAGDGVFSGNVTGSNLNISNWNTAYTHTSATNNPHSVTATQVGLGNVTNESKATMFSSPSFTGITYITDTNDVPLRVRSSDGASMIGISDSNSTNDYANGIGVYGNALHLTTNGNERIRIDASGNVGIGTASPNAKLDVNSGISTSSTDVLKLSQATNGAIKAAASLGISIQNGGESTNAADLWFTTATGGSLSERMRITSGGNVGIGTTSPAVDLEIKTATNSSSSEEGLRLYNAGGGIGAGVRIGLGVGATYSEKGHIRTDIVSGGAGRLFLGSNGSDRLVINENGKVLVNGAEDNSGKADFAVSGGTALAFRNNQVQMGGSDMNWNSKIFDDGQAKWAAWDRNIQIYSTGSNTGSATARDIIFSPQTSGSAASTERMRIKGSGNVGIGTSSPSSKLHINDTSVPSSGDLISSKIYSSGNVAANSNTRTGLDVETIRGGWYNSDSTSGNFKISSNHRIGDSDLIGVKSLATVDVNNGYSGVTAAGSLTAFYGKVSTTHTTGSGPVATGYGLRIDAPEVATDSEIGTYYGAYIDGASVSGTLTNKYALVTEASAGNVGIGTTTPSSLLHINAADGVMVDTYTAYIRNQEATAGDNFGLGIQAGSNSSDVSLQVSDKAGTSLLRVRGDGNVGIGTTSPSKKLEVTGDIKASATVEAARVHISSDLRHIGDEDTKLNFGTDTINLITAGTTALTVDSSSDVTVNNDLVVSGNLTVNGTTSTINSTTLQVDDKNIELGTVATPTDTTADGGGITLKGATDKTINWVNSTGAWTFSEKVSVPADGSVFGGSGGVPIYVRSTGTVSYIQIQNSSTGGSGSNDGLTVGCNGNAGYLWLREAANLNIGTNDTTAITISSSQNTTFAGKITSGNDIVNATAGVYTWVGDTDTYIQRSAGNEITIKTGASNALVLDSSQNATFAGSVTATSLIKSGGSSSEFLKADGSVDSSAYLTSLGTAIVDGDFTANGLMKRTGAGTYTSITDNSSNWDTAYTDRNKWDGGSTGLNASTGRTSLGLGSAATSNTGDFAPAAGSTSIVSLGTVVQGDWNAGVISSTYLDADTAHLSGAQTFSGAKTFSSASKFASLWSSSTIESNSFYVQNSTDGFAFGVGTGVSTWFSWDNNAGLKRAIDVWNDGSKILLGNGGHDVEVSNDLLVSQYMYHTGDTDTFIRFQPNDINLSAAGQNLLRVDGNSTQKTVVVNEVGIDADFRVEASGVADAFFVRGSDARVGIGTTSPDAQLASEGSQTIGWLNLSNSLILAGTATNGIGLDSNEIAKKGGELYVGTTDSGDDVVFRAGGGATRLTIDGSNGNITIANNATISGDLTVSTDFEAAAAVNFSALANAGSDVDKFLVSDSGDVKFRTGSEVLSDIGGQASISAPNAPASASAAIVGETVEVTFAASTTSNIDAYLVYSSIDGSDYGLISVVPPDDFAASMSIIDNAFDETGTQAYRVYAMKYGILSSAATDSVSYTVSSAEPTTMSVINLNNAYYVQWNPPSSNARFVTAYNVYKHEHATQGSLSRGSASLVYSGMNTNYMYQISGTNNNNFHQFWVETTIA